MPDLVVPFITGLTTGGLSCLAVQGGLLASTVARTAEKEIQQHLATLRTVRPGTASRARAKARTANAAKAAPNQRSSSPRSAPAESAAFASRINAQPAAQLVANRAVTGRMAAQPILVFLGAKLVGYTAFGFFLGALGSVLQLTSFTRAVMELGIGLFMLGTALNMLQVHPIFRYFVIEPPKFITRFMRRLSKNGNDDVATPAFLGALTVFIPCGVTQTMMAVAIGSADPFSGAAIMFAFILGTSPLFFALAYLARKLGQVMEARFMKFAAITVIVLALVSIDGGLNLLGSPLSFSAIGDALLAPSARSAGGVAAAASSAVSNIITMNVAAAGYTPNRFTANAGAPVTLKLVTDHSYG